MLQIILVVFATVNLLLTALVLFPLRQPSNFALWLTKVFISAMSPFLALLGLLLAVTGWLLQAWSILFLGTVAALIYFFHIITISTAPPRTTDMTSAFGSSWINQIPPARKSRFLPGRYVLRLPAVPQPDFEQNLPYHTLPDHQRQLLCDIWQPPKNVKRSGVAFIYLHGSAWTVLDKDYGTRRFFRHLAAQGHVVMDVAYRLFPETDFTGMVQDALYAIAWMKTHAAQYKVDPGQLVIGGGSAGAHIAMLAAFTTHNNRFTPTDLLNTDLSVRAVVSLYGPTDLKAAYDHTRQDIITQIAKAKKKKNVGIAMPKWMQKRMGDDYYRLGFDKKEAPGMLAPMLGGTPDEVPQQYALYSPITHVHKDCPPTLLLHGQQDTLVPVNPVRHLYARLKSLGVPVVMHLLPQTDHAFDLIFPNCSPSAQNAFFDVERFLAIVPFLSATPRSLTKGEERHSTSFK